ncbi:hypothetical protein JTB14_012474 [Gonioctena quinquepunctata]|nr:hypothetical protein JTB14_012474 [Gonioctena quinquepunctata]
MNIHEKADAQLIRDVLCHSRDDAITKTFLFDELRILHGRFRASSTAYDLGLHLKSITLLLESECIKAQDDAKMESVKDLLCLMRDGFQIDVNKTVSENQSGNKRHKKIKLITAEYIAALNSYLSRGRKPLNHLKHRSLIRHGVILRINFNIFNAVQQKKGGGICINDYRRKLNRPVPVIINKEYKDYIQLILKHREEYGVPEQNPYIFGTPGRAQHTHLHACVLIRHYAVACGALNPLTLRETELRKQIATACALYNLSDPLVEDVANYLGHNMEIYRQSTAREIPTMETLTISQSKGNLPENDNILDQPSTSANPNRPSTSGIGTVKRNVTKEGREELVIVSPEMLRPYPTVPLRKQSRTLGRKKGKCSIITDTPEEDELMKAEEERNNKSKKKGAKAKIVTIAKKKHCSSDSDTDGNISLHDKSPPPRYLK